MQNYLFMAGQTKAEKMFQEHFVLTEKKSGFQIIQEHGVNAFAMWWILQSYCYGKGKAHAFPSVKTLSKLVQKSERTVQRWLNDLERAKGIKSVPAYWENTGMQASNLYVMNPEFPDVPDWWEESFQYGAIRTADNEFYERPKPSKMSPDKNVTPDKSGTTNLSPLKNQGSDAPNAETPVKSGTTNLSPLENQELAPKNGKNVDLSGTTNLSPQEEEKDIYQEIKIDKKKNNNNLEQEIAKEPEASLKPEKEVVVVTPSDREKIHSCFQEKIGFKLSPAHLDELIVLAQKNLRKRNEEVTSSSIVDLITDFIRKVDKYNRNKETGQFKVTGFHALRSAIRDNYQYIEPETEISRELSVPASNKYAMLRKRQQAQQNFEWTEKEQAFQEKKFALRQEQMKLSFEIRDLEELPFLSSENQAKLSALKSQMQSLEQELINLDQQLEKITV